MVFDLYFVIYNSIKWKQLSHTISTSILVWTGCVLKTHSPKSNFDSNRSWAPKLLVVKLYDKMRQKVAHYERGGIGGGGGVEGEEEWGGGGGVGGGGGGGGKDLTNKKVGGCGGMRRGIWLGGWQTINQGRLGISGVLGQTQPLLTGHALHHIRIDPSGPASTSTSQNIIQCPLF